MRDLEETLISYLKVHGRRILANLPEDQDVVKIEVRALFRYFKGKGKLMDRVEGFQWRGCRYEGGYMIVPVKLIRELVEQ